MLQEDYDKLHMKIQMLVKMTSYAIDKGQEITEKILDLP